jgi:predicted SAM-dependent methyltransferase
MAKGKKQMQQKAPAKKPALPRKITGKSASPAKGVSFDALREKAGERKLVLHIGCGQPNPKKLHESFRNDDWYEVRLDIDASVKPDIVADMLDMGVIPDGAVDAVWSSHNIEHLYPHDVPAAMKEIYRIIRHGGHFLVTLPDIQTVASYVAQGLLEDPIYDSPAGPISPIDIMYGLRASMARGNLFMAHRTGYTAKTLGEYLQKAGFSNIRISRDWVDLWGVGHKLDSRHPDFREEVQISISERTRNLQLPPPLPLNRTPHPGAKHKGKMTDELDVPPVLPVSR